MRRWWTGGLSMKPLVELIVIWAGTLAIILAFILVNAWLMNEIGVMVGIEAAKYTIAAAVIAASAWVFGHKGDKK